MKEFKRIIAFVLTIVLMMGSFAFAEKAQTTDKNQKPADPTAVIVSPEHNSIVISDSFLVSVRLNKAADIKVSIYEVKATEKKVVTTYVSGSAVTKEAISYHTFDTEKFEEKDFTSNAALLTATDFLYTTPSTFSNPKDTIGFYTDKVENVKPGMYKVVVEVIEEVKTKDKKTGKETVTEKVIEETTSLICVKEKVETEAATLQFTQAKEKKTVVSVITNFIKSLFK